MGVAVAVVEWAEGGERCGAVKGDGGGNYIMARGCATLAENTGEVDQLDSGILGSSAVVEDACEQCRKRGEAQC